MGLDDSSRISLIALTVALRDGAKNSSTVSLQEIEVHFRYLKRKKYPFNRPSEFKLSVPDVNARVTVFRGSETNESRVFGIPKYKLGRSVEYLDNLVDVVITAVLGIGELLCITKRY